MKIKITENQHSKLKLVVEQEQYMVRYENLCNEKIKELEKIYTKVINMTIDDVLSKQLNAEQTIKILENIEFEINKSERSMINLWDTQAISGDENFDLKIKDIAEAVLDKVTSLTLLLNPIEELQRLQKEHNLTNQFAEIKPISIQNY